MEDDSYPGAYTNGLGNQRKRENTLSSTTAIAFFFRRQSKGQPAPLTLPFSSQVRSHRSPEMTRLHFIGLLRHLAGVMTLKAKRLRKRTPKRAKYLDTSRDHIFVVCNRFYCLRYMEGKYGYVGKRRGGGRGAISAQCFIVSGGMLFYLFLPQNR